MFCLSYLLLFYYSNLHPICLKYTHLHLLYHSLDNNPLMPLLPLILNILNLAMNLFLLLLLMLFLVFRFCPVSIFILTPANIRSTITVTTKAIRVIPLFCSNFIFKFISSLPPFFQNLYHIL